MFLEENSVNATYQMKLKSKTTPKNKKDFGIIFCYFSYNNVHCNVNTIHDFVCFDQSLGGIRFKYSSYT